MTGKGILIGIFVLCASGCDIIRDDLNGRAVSMSGAGILYGSPQEPISDQDLATFISSATPGQIAQGTTNGAAALSLVQVLGKFGTPLPIDDANQQNNLRYARNQIVGYVIAASNNRCNAFKLSLRERSTNISFGLGSFATSLGTAGAIFTNGTSQILSGLSGATSGVNAEYNKDIMSGVTSSVIIPGIDKQRAAILQEVMNRRCYGIESYSLTQALADAVRYHAACSTDVGVAAASSALSQTHSQSLADAQTAIDAVKEMHDKLYSKTDTGSSGQQGAKVGAVATHASVSKPVTAANPGATAATETGQQAASEPLLGASLNLLECPGLTQAGKLPLDASTQSASASTRGQFPTDKMPGGPAAGGALGNRASGADH